MSKKIVGACTALVTPFKESGEVDYDLLEKHLNMVMKNGAYGICVGGSTGEFEALTFDEAMKVCEAAVKVSNENNGYVIAGLGGRSTNESIKYAHNYEKLGADVLLVLPPYYFGFTKEEIIQYYLDVAEATSLPIMVYNNPGKTHVHISPEMIAEMASKSERIRFVKDSTADIRNISAVIKETNNKVCVFAGWDAIVLESLIMGAQGVFSGPGGNCIPGEVSKLYKYVADKDYENAFKQWDKIGPFHILMEDHGRLAAWVKAAVKLLHYDVGVPRKPYQPATKKEIEVIKASLGKMGAL